LNEVAANFEISKVWIARYGKPFHDGKFLKQVWVACVPKRFEVFQNRDKVL
jgi:hypothetical protein